MSSPRNDAIKALKSFILVMLLSFSSVSPILLSASKGGEIETVSNDLPDNTSVSHTSNNSTTDSDGDGLTDSLDSCPFGITSWSSNNTTDYDSDGCV
ncbi:hypothetical protein N9M86_03295, partial [Euryarchaeota archaeon]|nr:hypothetical protein [Euryarchaeota archaeon]MDA8690095.1 hypothetical protein [Euryarchaeota archaeon]